MNTPLFMKNSMVSLMIKVGLYFLSHPVGQYIWPPRWGIVDTDSGGQVYLLNYLHHFLQHLFI